MRHFSSTFVLNKFSISSESIPVYLFLDSTRSKWLKVWKRNVNPLELIHFDLHELILQHLDPADALISSEVSKHWFDVIGGSRKCMKQINLGLENWWQTETPKKMVKVMNIIQTTTRKYQNVHFNCNNDSIFTKTAVKLLKVLAPSLKDLKFFNADNILNDLEDYWDFPKLERLQFINNDSEIDDLLLQGSTQLKELNLKHHYWANILPVIECLKNNKNLVLLKLWDNSIGKLFEIYEPNYYQFKLKRFAAGSDGVVTKETEKKFLAFLESQSDSIEALRFRSGLDGFNGPIINKVFSMSAMRTIHLDSIGDMKQLNLIRNPKIIELRLPWSIATLEQLTPFLRGAPDLRVLCLRKVNKDILEYIANNMKSLEILFFSRADGCEACLRGILSVNDDSNNDIQLIFKEWF